MGSDGGRLRGVVKVVAGSWLMDLEIHLCLDMECDREDILGNLRDPCLYEGYFVR